jgi:hypothetical protein
MDESVKAHLPADKSLSGIFHDKKAAESAYGVLQEMGYGEDDVSILMSDEARVRYFPSPALKGEVVGEDINEGPGLGSMVGAGTGTALGAILGAAASLAVPGLGIVVVGPLAAILTGAVMGGMSGGLLGSLLGVGFSEDRAKNIEERIKQGNIIIALNPRSNEDAEMIIQKWRDLGGEIIFQR